MKYLPFASAEMLGIPFRNTNRKNSETGMKSQP